MPLQVTYVPSQVPMSQMPMYKQFPPIQNQLYTPDGNEPPVAMSMCVSQETWMYFPVPMISEIPPKPMYDTQLKENYVVKSIQMLKDKRYRKKSETFLRVYVPHACKPKEDSIYKESESNLIKTQYGKFLLNKQLEYRENW